jgi:hypothetical protein
MRNTASIAIAVLAAALVSACAISPHQIKTADILPATDDLPSVAKLPLRAGVYYSRDFVHEKRSRSIAGQIWIAPIGNASEIMFNDVFSQVFAHTTEIVDITPDNFVADNLEVAIAPTFEHFDFATGFDRASPRWSVAYRMTLYDRRGVPVASWVVAGNGPDSTLTRTIRNDLKDAATRFVRGFESNARPALAAIQARKEGSKSTVDPHSVVLSARPADFSGLAANEAATLREKGVLAVRLSARSKTERRQVIRASDTRLHLADGRVIEPSSLSSVMNGLDELAPDHAGAVAAVGGSLLGLLVAASEAQSQQTQRESETADVKETLFADRTLGRNVEESGLVLFRVPEDEQAVRPAALTVWIVDPAAADGAQVEVPLLEAEQ